MRSFGKQDQSPVPAAEKPKFISNDDIPLSIYIPMSFDKEYVPELPMIDPSEWKKPHLNTISADTLVDCLVNMVPVIIIDCRFDYEFQGGHIQGAMNMTTPNELYDMFFVNKDKV